MTEGTLDKSEDWLHLSNGNTKEVLTVLLNLLSLFNGRTCRGFILVPPNHVGSPSGNLNQSNKCLLTAYHVEI